MHLANGGMIAFPPGGDSARGAHVVVRPGRRANPGSTLQQTLASGARVLDVLDESPQTDEIEEGASLDGFDGAAASHVDFSYGDVCVLRMSS